MPKKAMLYFFGALTIFFLAGQSGQSQSTPEIPMKKRTCGGLWPVEQNGKWGYIDKTGRLLVPFKFDHAADFSEGLAAAGLQGKTGYIDKTGKFVIPPRFITGFSFSDGLAIVVIQRFRQDNYQMNKYVYIDRLGKVVIRPREALDSKSLLVSIVYKDLDFSEGFLGVEQKGKHGYMDKAGKIFIPFQYEDAASFSESLAAVKLNGKYGYIDRSGKMVIPPQFDDAATFSEGLARAAKGEQRGYIDKSSTFVIDGANFSLNRGFCEGLAAAKGENGKYGFIDKTGKFVIPPQYFRVGDFSESLAAVEPEPGELAYINPRGEMVIISMSRFPNNPDKTEFDLHVYRFCEGVARVNLGKKDDEDAGGYINKEGKFIWPKETMSKNGLR